MKHGEQSPAKYINSPESPIYKKREAVFGLRQARGAIRERDRAVLVEGNFDVVGLHARGLTHVVAPLGTAFTSEQARQIRRFSANLTLLFDGDTAGRRATQAARQACTEAGLSVRVASLPDGIDPDDLIRQSGVEAVEQRLGKATSMLEYLIDSTLDAGFASEDAEARTAAIRQVAELIRNETDPATRALAERRADRMAEKLLSSRGERERTADVRAFRALASAVHSAVLSSSTEKDGSSSIGRVQPPERARSRDRSSELPLEIFGALLDFPSLLDGDELLDALSYLKGDVTVAIAAMRQLDMTLIGGELEQLLAKLPPPIHPFAAARLAAPRHDHIDDARSELLNNVEKLKRLELSRQKIEVLDELERLQSSGDFDREMTLLREHERRARERHGL